jgi:hypothetical protein
MQSRQRLSPRGFTIFLLIIVLIGLTLGLFSGWRHADRFESSDNAHAVVVYHIQWLTALLGLLPISVSLLRLRKERGRFLSTLHTWLPIRSAVYFALAAVVSNSIAYGYGLVGESGFIMRSLFYSSYLFWAALWAFLVAGFPGVFLHAQRGVPHVADVVLANLIVTLLLLEGGLNIWASYSHSPLFWDVASIESTLKTYRQKPHYHYFDFVFNSQGYHDKEFFVRGENDFTAALLADSFGMGVVPYDFNFVTVAERDLQERLSGRYQRVAIHNFGIPCIGMQEYAHLIKTEVLKWRPNLVLVCAFLGNDIGERSGSRTGLRCFQGWFVWIMADRICAIFKERHHDEGVMLMEEGIRKRRGTVPPYIFDSSLEPPTFSEEAFLGIEQARLDICNPHDPSTAGKFEEFFEALKYMKSLLKERLILVLIPDQFQVDDALYDQLLHTKERPDVYVRDYPQQRIHEYCRLHRIPVLDLTQPLAVAQHKGTTYHLRDTHWNACGNRVAGEAIASFVIHVYHLRGQTGH